MKRLLFLALALFTVHCSLFTVASGQQSRTNQIYRPCPGTTTPARVAIQATGAIVVQTCPVFGVAGDITLTPSVGKSGTAVETAASGGGVAIVSGAGGVTTTAGESGSGGDIEISTGNGGASTTAAGNTSGTGGNIELSGGAGGIRTGATGDGGRGGHIIIDAGPGGTATGGASAGEPGEIRIGTAIRSNVEIGKALGVITLGDTQGGGNGTLVTIDDAAGEVTFAGSSAAFNAGAIIGGNQLLTFGSGSSINLDRTITPAATTGNRTINKLAGTVNIAAAGTNVKVINSLVTANSLVFAIARTNDATCSVKNVVSSSGEFTVTMTAGCTAETSVAFWVTN